MSNSVYDVSKSAYDVSNSVFDLNGSADDINISVGVNSSAHNSIQVISIIELMHALIYII